MRTWFLLLVACGGSGHQAPTMVDNDYARSEGPQIIASVASQTWYRSRSICGQGPYEIEVPVAGVKWGEEFELRLSTPRRIAVTAIILGDDDEVAKTAALFDRDGKGHGKAENLRCVADTKERLAAARGGGGGNSGPPVEVPVGTTVVTPPPGKTIQLEIEDAPPPSSFSVIRYGWRETGKRPKRIRIRLWSVDPNDLEDVRFGVARIEWRPNVSEAEWEAHLLREHQRLEARRRADEEAMRRQPVVYESADDREKRLREASRRQAEAERDRVEREREAAEEARHRMREAALELERKRRREAYCAAHHDSRDCWGAGGKARFDELAARRRERDDYCAKHQEDARCWSDTERLLRATKWKHRAALAEAPPKQPDGPPPTPRDETPPPKLSDNAEWRPGYWQWTGATWTWLGGMWRVPDEDIEQEKTTTAPVAPPPPREEPIPPPPMPTTIWVAGFWQWNGTSYIWVPGSYQLRPSAGVSWRPTEWRARGSVHILIPGGWIRGRR